MRNVLIGGLITLAVTLLVQILVIPWVQRRTRRRERWEKEVGELLNLVEVDLPTHLETLRMSWARLLGTRKILSERGADSYDMERVQAELLAPLRLKADESYEALGAITSRAILLQRRVSRVRPNAAVWHSLEMVLPGLNAFLWNLDPQRFGTEIAPTDEEHEEHYQRVKVHGETALSLIRFVSDPMKPPSADRWSRARRWMSRRLGLGKTSDSRAVSSADQGAAT